MGIKVTEMAGFPVLPLGQYQMSLTGAEWKPTQKEGWKDQIVWKFATVDTYQDLDGEPVDPGLSVWLYTPDSWGPRSKAWAVAETLADGEVDMAALIVNGELDVTPLLGRVATVKVDTYEKDGELKNTVVKTATTTGITAPQKRFKGLRILDYVPGDEPVAVEDDDDIPF